MKRLVLWICVVLSSGCSCEAVVATDDGGGVDAGPLLDAAPIDGGPLADAGPIPDAGPTPDAGTADSDAGLDGGGCTDADADGVTDCDGDCDDADPLTYPGAPEICGDGVDNACGSAPDPTALCAQIGTHVSTAGNDTTGEGTRENPVRTIAQGIANAVTIGAPTTVVVAGGTYDETVTLVEGVSIQGGFDCAALPCSWAHDPSSHETVIDGGATANAIEGDDTISRATQIQDVALLSGRTGASLVGASPVVRRVRIAASQGILAYGGNNPLIEDCVVVATNSGVILDDSGELRVSDVQGAPAVNVGGPSMISHNTLHASGETGIFVGGSSMIEGNRINEDASRVGTCGFDFCSGIAIWGGSPVITNNIVYGMGGAESAAISIVHGELSVEEPIVHSNTLYAARTAAPGSINAGVSCTSFFGLAMFGEVRNNIVIGASDGTSYGFYETDHDNGEACRPVLIENNDFFGVDHVARFWATPETLFTTVTDADAESWATGNLSADPLLDAAHRLQAGSPCIDQGTATEAPTRDRDGEARPAGAGYDIGADERP